MTSKAKYYVIKNVATAKIIETTYCGDSAGKKKLTYQQWVNRSETVPSKGVEKVVQATLKSRNKKLQRHMLLNLSVF